MKVRFEKGTASQSKLFSTFLKCRFGGESKPLQNTKVESVTCQGYDVTIRYANGLGEIICLKPKDTQ